MKRRTDGGFWLCFLMNLIFSLEWSIPAWLLLIMHFVLNWSLWLFVGALGVFIIGVFAKTAVLCWAASAGSVPDKPKKNLNPYSAKNEQMLQKKEEDE